eukprot:scaffold5085_cov73-Phaeocystis_antarctica.AAC.1
MLGPSQPTICLSNFVSGTQGCEGPSLAKQCGDACESCRVWYHLSLYLSIRACEGMHGEGGAEHDEQLALREVAPG